MALGWGTLGSHDNRSQFVNHIRSPESQLKKLRWISRDFPSWQGIAAGDFASWGKVFDKHASSSKLQILTTKLPVGHSKYGALSGLVRKSFQKMPLICTDPHWLKRMVTKYDINLEFWWCFSGKSRSSETLW